MPVSKITSRLPEPPSNMDGNIKSFVSQLLRVLRSNFQILEKNSQISINTVTLTAGAALSTVSDAACNEDSHINLMAKTATASAATGVWIVPTRGQFIIHHNNTADTDKIFSYCLTNLNTV